MRVPDQKTSQTKKTRMNATEQNFDLSVELGRLKLSNPILVASGTFGYAREMAGQIDLSQLGGIVPKTITQEPRQGNAPWRTVEVSAGMLNSIGLDNDGLESFISHHLPYLGGLKPAIIVSIAGRSAKEYSEMARRLTDFSEVAALELNMSCPNVSGGTDFGINPTACETLVAGCRVATTLPIFPKLTPNVANIPELAKACEAGGADAVALINTCFGMALDWRRQRPLLGNVMGGLSGPAIKPIALRCVFQAARAIKIPVIGIGGIATIDDAMEFFVAGASAIQLGTVNFYNPQASQEILKALPTALAELGVKSLREIIGSIKLPA